MHYTNKSNSALADSTSRMRMELEGEVVRTGSCTRGKERKNR